MGTVESDVYVARGYSREGEAPMVTAVWFKVDILHPVVNLRDVLSRIRGRAALSSSMCGAQDGGGDRDNHGAVQSASGIYIESGIGILAGTGRSSICIGGHSHSLPYYRKTHSENEELLAELMHGVACVIETVDPRMVSRQHGLPLQRAHQYPRQRLFGDVFVNSHQTVIRMSGGANDPQGSDLHLDPMDGHGNAGGGWTIYAGEPPGQFDDLAVFASATGGVGFCVRVGGFGEDWVCALHTDTAHRLHGSVWPDSTNVVGGARGSGLRVVTYTLRRVEQLEESVLRAPSEEQKAMEASSPVLKHRVLGQWGGVEGSPGCR